MGLNSRHYKDRVGFIARSRCRWVESKRRRQGWGCSLTCPNRILAAGRQVKVMGCHLGEGA